MCLLPVAFKLNIKGKHSSTPRREQEVLVARYVSLTSDLLERLGTLLCRLMHEQITHPVQGHYVCLKCMRKHSVNF